jgi:hypothetical protein
MLRHFSMHSRSATRSKFFLNRLFVSERGALL